MSEESRVKRWRANKREQGLKHVSVWLTPEEELRLKDLALQWHCSASEIVQRSLAQFSTHPPEYSSPTDTSQIRRLILAELEALGLAVPTVRGKPTVSESVGPTDTKAATDPAKARPARRYEAEPGHSIVTERTRTVSGQNKLTPLQAAEMRGKKAAGTPIKTLMAEYGISKATVHRYLKEA